MKKRFLFAAALCAVMLTACGSSGGSVNGADASSKYFSYEDNNDGGKYQYIAGAFSKGGADGDYYSGDIYGYPAEPAAAETAVTTAASSKYEYYEEYEESYDAETANASEDYTEADNPGGAESSIQKEMLVYYCTMEIDTLDFEGSLNSFRNTLDMYGGFIEQENYSDGGGGNRWYYENEDKWQSYTATLRVPSKNYEAFCNSAGQLGDLRGKNARVENVSQEYSDLATTLEIYEAKEDRYIALLANITEDEYAVAVERELTDIQINIANIRTRMNAIRTDVAYSYVYITLNEVKEYVSAPVKTDTFFDRLSNTLSDAGNGFLEFLEGLLFMIIYLAPYLVLIGIVVFVIILIVKKSKKRRADKRAEKALREEKAEQPGEEADVKEDTEDNE